MSGLRRRTVETVDDIIADIRQRATVACGQDADATVHHNAIGDMLVDIADRIEAAWKREKEAVEQDAIEAGAFVAEAMRPRRNCDKFQDYDTAKEEWFHECCYWFGGCNACGGTFTKRDEEPDFERWLFMPVKQEESK